MGVLFITSWTRGVIRRVQGIRCGTHLVVVIDGAFDVEGTSGGKLAIERLECD